MDVTCRIRAARSADLPVVARIEAATFQDPWSARVFSAHVADIFLIAERPDGVVGYLVARAMGDEAEILNVAVATAARRGGIGQALLDACLVQFEHAGVRTTYLEVRPSNAPALRLYASRGFTVVGRRRGYYVTPREDALVLRRHEG